MSSKPISVGRRTTMKKTLVIAAALLSLGVGSAFAGDGDPHAQPPARTSVASAQDGQNAHRLFPATTRHQTDVYPAFGYAEGDSGTTQGG
jgi:hypothetical protein